jgi:hypothetical protein
MDREWKPVEGFEGLYEVSNYGEVKSLERLDSRGNHLKEKLLSPGKDSKGYLRVTLSKNGVVKTFKIHRLVYGTFVGEIPKGIQCNHIDENKENNRVDNLNLMTPKENINWGTHNTRMAAALSKAVEAVDKVTGRVVYVFPSTMEAGRQGFNQVAVASCCRNYYNRPGNNVYKGFIWRYKDNIHVNQ